MVLQTRRVVFTVSPARRPVSLVAERAIRYLGGRSGPVDSIEMAHVLLATKAPDESTARQVLESAFAGDPRLRCDARGWTAAALAKPATAAIVDPPRVLLLVEGARIAPGRPFVMSALASVRMERSEVVSACGGNPSRGRSGIQLRKAVLEMLEGAVPVWFDPPGARVAVEAWLDEPLSAPVSLRVLARRRVGREAAQDLESLAAKLGLTWRGRMELLDQAEVLDSCLARLRTPGERLEALRGDVDGAVLLDWSRFGFDRAFLRELPATAGTYRFFDDAGHLVYVGKAKNLHRRVGSYFREGAPRPPRVQKLLDALYRIEVDTVGSDLEALLSEAAQIRRKKPAANVQREIRPRRGVRAGRLRSILILEPAVPPFALRAYLLRDGCLVGKIGVGPRGAGLARIERILQDHFFGIAVGPTPASGPQVEVELVSRWLADNRDRVVAFGPTDLGSGQEVVRRLRWFLDRGALREPDGTPILTR